MIGDLLYSTCTIDQMEIALLSIILGDGSRLRTINLKPMVNGFYVVVAAPFLLFAKEQTLYHHLVGYGKL